MKTLAIVLALSVCSVQAKGSSHVESPATSPRATCMWQVPGEVSYLNLYAVQAVRVIKVFGDWTTRVHYGYSNSYDIAIKPGEDATIHTRAIMARLKECQE